MFISFDDPAVLTTLPPTWTTSAAELEAVEVESLEPLEQPAINAQDNPSAANAVSLVSFGLGNGVV